MYQVLEPIHPITKVIGGLVRTEVEELTFEEILISGRSEVGDILFEERLLSVESEIEELEFSERLFDRGVGIINKGKITKASDKQAIVTNLQNF